MVMKKKAAVMKAMKAKKIKVPMKAAAKKKNAKPKKWLKLRPHGCSKCRYIPGCTLSCWGGKPPK
jgi:radical SAM protein with 4Fe4S-binding SPASM domain